MPVRPSRLLAASALAVVAACSSDKATGPINTPLPASLQVGDLVRLNVNGKDACSNPTYHVARVEAIGDKSIILADTLNPTGGFTSADYLHYAATFDTLIYPIDEGAFGAPTDIDNNGRVGIVFTRAVNELTPRNPTSYVGGFTFSRDLFPVTSSNPGAACPTSNQGEFFYALAPDPTGTINGNRRTVGFVDSTTFSVLVHEMQHLINASRKLYVNTSATSFEDRWLDEGLAHMAEELLFYRESGTQPRTNLDVTAIKARSAIVRAFNLDMTGNAGRYTSYLADPNANSPYANNDSLATRGAAWSWLRYLADQKQTSVVRSPTADIEQNGPGTVSIPGGAAGAEYYATLVNTSADSTSASTASYSVSASNVVAPGPALIPIGGAMLSRSAVFTTVTAPTLQRDVQFEKGLRARERAMMAPRIGSARGWYRSELGHIEVPQGGRYAVSAVTIASPDGDLWFRLVNNSAVGLANVQQVFGVDPVNAVSDWSASHAVDDVSALVSDQFLQKSWNWHSIYPALCSANSVCTYPLPVRTMVAGTTYTGTILPGGSTHFRLAVLPAQSAAMTVGSGTFASALRLVVVRTK